MLTAILTPQPRPALHGTVQAQDVVQGPANSTILTVGDTSTVHDPQEENRRPATEGTLAGAPASATTPASATIKSEAVLAPAVSDLKSATGSRSTAADESASATDKPKRPDAFALKAPKLSLELFPPQVQFGFADDHQQLIVLARFEDGSTRDVTAQAIFKSTQPAVAEMDAASPGKLLARGVGQASIEVSWNALQAAVPVQVADQATKRPLRFRNDFLPVLTRVGCNTGKCHGAASGKDGFRLSLFGYDPEGDHFRITSEWSGRRINLGNPLQSLLLQKATGSVPHTGGQLIEAGSEQYRTLALWLAEGAPADPPETPLPVGIQVYPQRAVMSEPGQQQQLMVLAEYNDGSLRDVTSYAVFLSNNEAVATVDQAAQTTGTGPGAAFILARFDQYTAGSSIVVRSGQPYPGTDFVPKNYIDQATLARWQDLHLVPAPLCSDERFVRRVYLDTVGRVPTAEQRAAFLADTRPNRRDLLIDQLVDSADFQDMWIMKLAEMLQIRSANGLSDKGLQLYDSWLRKRIHDGATVDQVVRELIPASGGTFENPATIYYQTETTPQLLAENLAQAFLGMRLQCAQCHNHPFDRWTMDDYYGFASFVSQVGYKQAKDPREITIYNAGEGSLKHPVANREVRLKFLGGDYVNPTPGDDYRTVLANWLTSDKNAAFASHLANVWWAHFFGQGIVEPVDDVRVSNPPSNPVLLQNLANKLIEYRFDVRKLAKDICRSHTYQLDTQSNAWNRWDERDFSRARVRRLRAEVLLDCISQVTATSDQLTGLPLGGRAIQVPGGATNHYFLETFGRASRQTPCSCEVSTSPTLSQALHLLNGENTSGKIAKGGLIEKWLDQGAAPVDVATTIYIRCLGREPSEKERTAIATQFSMTTDARAELADLFWAVLNSNEFIFNH